MSSRLFIWILCAGAVALACGPRARSEASPPPPANAVKPQDGSPFASSLNVEIGEAVRLSLHLTNATDQAIELQFPSGQTHDFVVLDSTGTEVWRWGAERMFTQALQTRAVSPDETVTFAEEWFPEGRTGTFTVIGRVAAMGKAVEHRVEFRIP